MKVNLIALIGLLGGCASAGSDCGPDWYAIGQRDGVLGVQMQSQAERYAARCTAQVDQARYASDQFFRAAADSAVRAVRNPQCSPLKLPQGKYDDWKSISIRFDPKDVL